MQLTMTSPCPKCPFRTDIAPYLRASRAAEIADGLTRLQGSFQCHATVDYSGDEPREDTPNAQHCAGALIVLERMNRPNQLMRWMERIGAYDRRGLQMDAQVFASMRAFIAAHVASGRARPVARKADAKPSPRRRSKKGAK